MPITQSDLLDIADFESLKWDLLTMMVLLLVLSLDFFLLKMLNYGLFGRVKITALRPNLKPANKEQL